VSSLRRMCLLTVVVGLSLLTASIASADSIPSGFELVSENDYAELYIKADTAEIAYRSKIDGSAWFSNPPDRATMETRVRGVAKDRLSAQLVINYYSINQKLEMDSYNDCVKYGQYQITPIPGGVRVDYELGRRWQESDYVPFIISEERFNDLVLAKLDEKTQNTLRKQYVKFTLEEGYVDTDNISVFGVDMEALFGPYGLKVDEPGIKATDKRRVLQEYLNRVRDANEYTTLAEIKTEDIEEAFGKPALMQKWNLMQWDRDALVGYFKAVGYTPEDVQIDHQMFGIEPPWPDVRNFKVSVEYVLDGADLVARIPAGSVSCPMEVYDPKIKRITSYPLTTIHLLPYFGAANVDSEGYIFVPDGPGALIYLNNGKTTAEPYGRTVYGRDYATMPVSEYSADSKEQIYLPVFGLKNGDRAFVAMLEDGDAMAQINAVVEGMRDSYNRVWGSFEFIPNARINLQTDPGNGYVARLGALSIIMYQSRPYSGDMTVRYSFLSGYQVDYSAMAKRYRDYLVDKYDLGRIDAKEGMPLILEIIGSFDRTKPVLGFPKNVVQATTTYDQAEEIIDDLLKSGVQDLQVRYRGWLKGGVNHIYPTRVVAEGEVGSLNRLKQFLSSSQQKDVGVFLDVGFLNILRNSLLDGFVTFRDASRFLNRKSAVATDHNLASHQVKQGSERPVLSPSRLPSLVQNFVKDYNKLGAEGISLTFMGKQLNSDFRLDPDAAVDRQQAKQIAIDQVKLIARTDYGIMVTGGNAYMLPYAKYVIDAPMHSVGTTLVDASVPFFHIVASGHVVRAGTAANLSEVAGRRHLLKTIETGCVPYFVVTHSPSSDMKNTQFDYLYATTYRGVRDDILSFYNEILQISGNLWSQEIIQHEVVMPQVHRTVYEDGTSVIVNYRMTPVEVDGVLIDAEDYLVLAGGDRSAD